MDNSDSAEPAAAKDESVPAAPAPAPAPAPTSAQKPIQEPAKPADEHHKSGFLHDLGHRLKEAVKGDHHSDTPKDGTRGLDLESEIGKRKNELPLFLDMTGALTQSEAGPPIQPKDTSYTEYICTLKGPKHILQQTYIVHVFVGEFDTNTDTWCTQDALVGTFTVFGKALTTGCEKCARDAEEEMEVSGTVNLTAALIKEVNAGHLGSVEKANVIPWLRNNLHWRVTLADGTEKERAEVPHLKVGVVSTEVLLPVGKRPQFSGIYEVHTEVTEGRPAGLNPSGAAAAAPA
jgi:tyrosinase